MALQSQTATDAAAAVDGAQNRAAPEARPEPSGENQAQAPAQRAQPVADAAVAEAERIAFLALASELARSRKVLVVDDGASALAGIAAHLDSCSLAELEGIEDGTYELVVADIRTADAESGAGIARLARVVNPADGVALVRLPNRPEFAPMLTALGTGFGRQLALHQHNWVSSALFDEAMFVNDDPSRAVAASVRKLAAADTEQSLYNVIVAVHGAFPQFRPQLALTRSPELKVALADAARARQQLADAAAEHEAERQRSDARIRQLEEELAWYDENQLALRETVETSGFAQALLALWVTFASNLHRIRRVLRG